METHTQKQPETKMALEEFYKFYKFMLQHETNSQENGMPKVAENFGVYLLTFAPTTSVAWYSLIVWVKGQSDPF